MAVHFLPQKKELIIIFSKDLNQSALIGNMGDTNLLSAGLCVLNAFAHATAIISACVYAWECVNECVKGRQ